MRTFKVDEATAGLRADVFVTKQYPQHSRASLEKLFDEQLVKLNQKPLKPSQKMRAGEEVEVNDSVLNQNPPNIEIPVIFEDKNVIVLNKPAGVLTHSKGGFNNESTVASFISHKLDKDLNGNRAGIVHRLDRATSGVIICAKNQETLGYLQKQFSTRKTKKTYLAVVEGRVEPVEAIIDTPIERNPKKPQTFRVGTNGKSAQTNYEVLKTLNKSSISYSVLELKPVTGRTHQLRVHLKYIGHPVLGDRIYGKADTNMLLHAASLEVTIPGGQRKIFKAQPPEYFAEYV